MPSKKPKAVTQSDVAPWDRLYIIGGDPCLCRLFLQGVIEDLGNPNRIRFDRTDSLRALKDAMMAFSFGDVADAIIISDPSADQLRACQEAIESGVLTASALVIITPGDMIDGRASLAQQAQKRGRVTYLSPIEAGERARLLNHLTEWESGTGQVLTEEARRWMIQNAPTQIVKIKGASGKREVEVYDLQWIENELDKVIAVKHLEPGPITVSDLKSLVRFEQGVDIWQFIDAATSGNAALSLSMLYALSSTQGVQGALILLASQLEFLMSVRCLQDRQVRSVDEIARQMSLQPYLGRYLLQNWSEALDLPEPAAPNPWRVRKAVEKTLPPAIRLSGNYQAVISAIQDLRAGLDERIVLPYLALCLAGENHYVEPLKGQF
jgi:hypothetical protein